MLNGLRQLEAQIKGLPNQETLRSQLEVFRNVAKTAEERLAEVKMGAKQVNALRQIAQSPSLLKSELERWQKQGSNNSRDIVKLLNGAASEQAQITTKLTALTRMTTEVKSRTSDEWQSLCIAHQERAHTFKALAERLDPSAAKRLQDAAMLMRPSLTPLPTEDSTIRIAIEARETLTQIMGSLKIEGPVESFLQNALQGTAEPKSLFDPQVKAYLDAHPALWLSLKVVLK